MNIPGLFPMSPSSFSSTLSVYLDFHRTYLFRCMFFDSGIVNLGAAILTTNLIAQTATPVSMTTDIQLGWQATKYKLAGKTTYSDWKVTLRDDHLNAAHTYLQKWRDAVYNLKTGLSAEVDTDGGLLQNLLGSGGYKKQAIVILLGHVGLGTALQTADTAVSQRAYILKGVWPKDIGEVSLDYSTESIITLPVTFAIDYFEPFSLTGLATSGLSV